MAKYEFPASLAQRWMWLLAEMDPGEPTYNIPWALWLDGVLDVSALQQAWDAALVRHEALRTTFRNASGVPVQVVGDEPDPWPLVATSVEHLATDEREPAALAMIRDLARIPFDLATGPLVRTALIRLAPESHVLAVIMHHIVADGWTFRILFGELSADYEAIGSGGGPVAIEPPIQYVDFAIWQTEHAQDGGYTAAERFWRAELADAPAPLALPADAPYPARQAFTGQAVTTTIDPGLVDQLRKLATEHETTLFAVLLAAYSVGLLRLTGSDDLLIAVPMAARVRPETASVVGLFMNTVVIRVRIDTDGTLGDLLRSVHTATVRAMAQQDLPFARVVELVKPKRDQARLPLVQVMFAMEESLTLPDRGGLRWRPEMVEIDTVKFEIELAVTDAPTGTQLRIAYNTALFEPATAQRLARNLRTVLAHMAAKPTARTSDLFVLEEGEAAALAQWNATAKPSPTGDDVTLRDLFERQARQTPDAIAVAGDEGKLSYAQLDSTANVIARRLIAEGVGSESVVAVVAERSADLITALLGVVKTGAAFLPLDPEYPAERLAYMLADSRARVVLAQRQLGDLLPQAGPPVLYTDDAPTWPVSTTDGGRPALRADNAAYLIYTSGSTGRPKGVINTHRGLLNRLDWMRSALCFDAADVLLHKTSVSFDVAVWEFFLPLTTGASLALARPGGHRDPGYLRGAIAAHGVTVLHFVPSMLTSFLADTETDGRAAFATLKRIVCSGEELPVGLARRCLEALPGVSIQITYGPAEAAISVTTWQATPDSLAGRSRVPIGGPVSNVQVHILDSELRPVPIGAVGELYLGGVQVGRGYHRRPALTAQRFVPDPFGPAGSRLYVTGDYGRWRPDGTIEFMGRIDGQIKLRGMRIELGEIEVALRDQPGVQGAAVAVREVGPDDKRLVGYIVGSAAPDAGALRAALRARLPEYMVPAAFVSLDALPLTGSGKLDRRALPDPDWTTVTGQVSVAPRTPVEARLATVFAEVLGLPRPVGVHDDFFALGGHSLTATQLLARIRVVFGVDLPMRALFADPTVAGVAAALAAAGSLTAD
ncbi:MAG TPA: amino acid adenylation domain-containing protein [Streptosporangiaceae bacterium]|nr:amino acid adenylation domain-containing protein [Streptosporangiaceae bacterium]